MGWKESILYISLEGKFTHILEEISPHRTYGEMSEQGGCLIGWHPAHLVVQCLAQPWKCPGGKLAPLKATSPHYILQSGI